MNSHPRLAYALLAAGASRRFGGLKQLAQVDVNKTLLEHTLEVLLNSSATGVDLILGCDQQKIRQSLRLQERFQGVRVIVNDNWHSGMASSIKCAINHVDQATHHGLMIVLADQVALRSEHLRKMQELWCAQNNKIVASQYAGITGAPAIFPARYFTQLGALSGDQGAKALFHQYASDLVPFELSEASIDIDTQIQLDHWLANVR